MIYNNISRFKVKICQKINPVNINQRKGVAILTSDHVEFRKSKLHSQKRNLYNDKKASLPRRHSDPKCTLKKNRLKNKEAKK